MDSVDNMNDGILNCLNLPANSRFLTALNPYYFCLYFFKVRVCVKKRLLSTNPLHKMLIIFETIEVERSRLWMNGIKVTEFFEM